MNTTESIPPSGDDLAPRYSPPVEQTGRPGSSLSRLRIISRTTFAILFVPVIIGALYFTGRGLQEDATYNKAVVVWMNRYADLLNQFDSLAQTPHFDDPTWQASIHQQLRNIKAVSADLRSYQPSFPNPLNSKPDGLIFFVANPYDEFADLYTKGLDTKDLTQISQAQKIRTDADFQRLKFLELSDENH